MTSFVTSEQVKAIVASALCGKNPKDMGRKLDVTDRTIRNWASMITEPSASQLLNMIRESDEVYNAALILSGRDPDHLYQVIQQARNLLGSSIVSPAKQDAACQSSFQHTNLKGRQQLWTPQLATKQ